MTQAKNNIEEDELRTSNANVTPERIGLSFPRPTNDTESVRIENNHLLLTEIETLLKSEESIKQNTDSNYTW